MTIHYDPTTTTVPNAAPSTRPHRRLPRWALPVGLAAAATVAVSTP